MSELKCKSMSREERREKLDQLVENFRANEAFFKSKSFVKSEVRNKFIDPLLECLGWDVRNEKEVCYDRREVITEDKIEIEGRKKSPDYSLCYGGARRIYVEAKQPSVNIRENADPAFQVRRYAYTAKMPIAILTNFEEFAIYDTRYKPKQTDSASEHRVFYIRYDKYLENFDFLYDRISWEAVDLGKFDTYYEQEKEKKGTSQVDDEILKMIEAWRVDLAMDIARHNETVDEHDLTSVVQKLIDRIMFLRICEDKEIEPYGALLEATNPNLSKRGIMQSLQRLFTKANEKFNSGLFEPDAFLDSLEIGDEILTSIIKQLYYPECPYEFSVLPIEILGTIYERFLGKIIRFSRKNKNGHSIQVIEKPEVQKAGGVYYTPSYIVRYIVEQTIGQKIRDKKPAEVAKMRFLDPACGSGSFLVGAYQYLLDYHLDYYTSDDACLAKKLKNGEVYKDLCTQTYKLSVSEKRRILTNNIFGLDIDRQATEVTKLALFLKLLEEEGSAGGYLLRGSEMQREKLLPNLDDNVKCGNSLVGTDYLQQPEAKKTVSTCRHEFWERPLTSYSKSEQIKMNPFDWDGKQGFPEIIKNGGFDCVIGNPPYVNISILPKYHEYFSAKYTEVHTGYNDLMYYFLYKGIKILKKDGFLGVITSNYFIGNDYAKKLRLFLGKYVEKFVNFGKTFIFENANVHTTLVFATGRPKEDTVRYYKKMTSSSVKDVNLENDYSLIELNRCELGECWLIADRQDNKIIEKLKKNAVLLGDICNIEKGSTSGKNSIFIISVQLSQDNYFEKELVRKNVKNGDILRYLIKDRGNVLIYTDNMTNIDEYPNVKKYLLAHKKELSARNEVAKGLYNWYRFERPRSKMIFDAKEKLIVPYRATHNRFAYDDQQCFNDGGDIRALVMKDGVAMNIKYVLGLLNSSLLDWFYGFIGKSKGDMREYFNKPLAEIPIHIPTVAQQEKMVKFVDLMLTTQSKLSQALSASAESSLRQKVEAIDAQINRLVYDLYALTPEEIRTIEG